MNNRISPIETPPRSNAVRERLDCRCLYCRSLKPKQPMINRLHPRNDSNLGLTLTQLVPGHCYELGGGDLTLGKESNNKIIVSNDIHVARHHCCVSYERDQYWIQDLGSRQGTQVNGQYVIGREILHRDDIVKIGRTLFTVT